MTEKIIKRSRIYATANMVVAAIGLILGLVLFNNNNVGGVIVSVCSSLVLIAALISLLDAKPRIVMSNEGISARAWNFERVSWDSLAATKLEGVARVGQFITLTLKNGETRTVSVEGLDIPPRVINSYILEEIEALANETEP